VGNFSQDYAVAFLQLPVAYSADIDLACVVDGITTDAISMRLTVAVRANAQWAVERELRRRILVAFDENGIRRLHLDGLARGAVETLEKAGR